MDMTQHAIESLALDAEHLVWLYGQDLPTWAVQTRLLEIESHVEKLRELLYGRPWPKKYVNQENWVVSGKELEGLVAEGGIPWGMPHDAAVLVVVSVDTLSPYLVDSLSNITTRYDSRLVLVTETEEDA